MISRVLPPTLLKVGDAKLTLNKGISGAISQQSKENFIILLKRIETIDGPVTAIRHAQSDMGMLDELADQLRAKIDELLTAASALRGAPTQTPAAPLVEACVQCRALSAAIVEAVPDSNAEDDLADLAEKCESVANTLSVEYESIQQRSETVNNIFRSIVGRALTRKDVDVEALAAEYEDFLPDGLEIPDLPDTPTVTQLYDENGRRKGGRIS